MRAFVLFVVASVSLVQPGELVHSERFGMTFVSSLATDGDCEGVRTATFASFGESVVNEFRRSVLPNPRRIFEATVCSPDNLDSNGDPYVFDAVSSSAKQLQWLLSPRAIERLLKFPQSTRRDGKFLSLNASKELWSDSRSSLIAGVSPRIPASLVDDAWGMCGFSFRGLVLPNSSYRIDRLRGKSRTALVLRPGSMFDTAAIIAALCR